MFLVISLDLLLEAKTEWKDVYAAACSIVGGVIGGIITLEGVKRTILAQKDQESLKLIPTKLVALHKLTMQKEEVIGSISEEIWNICREFSNSLKSNYSIKGIKNFVDVFFELHKLKNYTLQEKEYELIEVASQIDIEIYKEIVLLFEELRKEFTMPYGKRGYADLSILAIKNSSNSREEDFIPTLPEDFDYEVFLESLRSLITDLSNIAEWLMKQKREFLVESVNLKLEQYGKEML